MKSAEKILESFSDKPKTEREYMIEQAEALIEENKENIINYKVNLTKSYCGRCNEGKLFNPWKHKYYDCVYCEIINKHNHTILNRGIDKTFGAKNEKTLNLINSLNDGIKDGKFPGASVVINISDGFDVESYKDFMNSKLLISKNYKMTFATDDEVLNNYNRYIESPNLFIVVYPSAQYDFIDYLESLLIKRASVKKQATIILSYKKNNNFYSRLQTNEIRLDKLKFM